MEPRVQHVGVQVEMSPGSRITFPDGKPEGRYEMVARIEVGVGFEAFVLDVPVRAMYLYGDRSVVDLALTVRVREVAVRSA